MRQARITLAICLTALASLALAGCGKGTPTAPLGGKITVSANPMEISSNGSTTLTVRVARASGLPVNPGTEVQLFTTLGQIVDPVVTTDESGIAVGVLRGAGKQGTAKVTASSGGVVSPELEITIGQKAATLTLQTSPTSIDPTVNNHVKLFAFLRDDQGEPIADALVVFTTEAGTLASRGAGVRTNAAGQATDTLTVTANDASAVADGSIQVAAQVTFGGGSPTATATIILRTDG